MAQPPIGELITRCAAAPKAPLYLPEKRWRWYHISAKRDMPHRTVYSVFFPPALLRDHAPIAAIMVMLWRAHCALHAQEPSTGNTTPCREPHAMDLASAYQIAFAAAAQQHQPGSGQAAADPITANGYDMRWPVASSVAASQQPPFWLPSVPGIDYAMAQQGGAVSLAIRGCDWAMATSWQQPSAPPVLVVPPAQAPPVYHTGMDEYYAPSFGPGRGCNGTPYAMCVGSGSARVQAPAPRAVTSSSSLAQQCPPSTVVQTASAAPSDAGERFYGSGVASVLPSWLRPQLGDCSTEPQLAEAGCAHWGITPRDTPQQQLQQETHPAAADCTADEAIAGSGSPQHSEVPESPSGAPPAGAMDLLKVSINIIDSLAHVTTPP